MTVSVTHRTKAHSFTRPAPVTKDEFVAAVLDRKDIFFGRFGRDDWEDARQQFLLFMLRDNRWRKVFNPDKGTLAQFVARWTWMWCKGTVKDRAIRTAARGAKLPEIVYALKLRYRVQREQQPATIVAAREWISNVAGSLEGEQLEVFRWMLEYQGDARAVAIHLHTSVPRVRSIVREISTGRVLPTFVRR